MERRYKDNGSLADDFYNLVTSKYVPMVAVRIYKRARESICASDVDIEGIYVEKGNLDSLNISYVSPTIRTHLEFLLEFNSFEEAKREFLLREQSRHRRRALKFKRGRRRKYSSKR